jgi:hypothetical protein
VQAIREHHHHCPCCMPRVDQDEIHWQQWQRGPVHESPTHRLAACAHPSRCLSDLHSPPTASMDRRRADAIPTGGWQQPSSDHPREARTTERGQSRPRSEMATSACGRDGRLPSSLPPVPRDGNNADYVQQWRSRRVLTLKPLKASSFPRDWIRSELINIYKKS